MIPNLGLLRDLQEVQSVLPGEVGNGHEMAFSPQKRIWEARNRAHMDSGTDDPAPFSD